MVRFQSHSRDALDKWAFFIALLVGSAGIVALRFAGLVHEPMADIAGWLAIIPAVLAIAGYAVYAFRTPQSQVNLDQTADNAYYLGLLFTLVSLIFALWHVQNLLTENDLDARTVTVLELLPDFGLALVSTVAGIVARVVLQQFRGGIEEAEERAQFELSYATAEFRDKLYVAVGDFTNAARAATSAVGDITAHTQTTLKAAADSTADAVREAGKQIGEAGAEFAAGAETATQHMQEFAEQSGEAMQKLQTQIDAVTEGWSEQHAAALEALGRQGAESLNQLVARGGELLEQIYAQSEAAAEQFRKQTERADADSARVGKNLAALGDHAAEARTKIAQLTEVGETFTRTFAELNGTLQNATKHAAEQVAGVEKFLEQTKITVADSAHIGGSLASLGDGAAEAQTKFTQLAESSEKFTRTFAELNRVLQDATKRATEQAAAASSHKRKRKWRFWRRQG